MLDGLAIAHKGYTQNRPFTHRRAYTHSHTGLTIAIVISWELASHGKQQVLVKEKGYVYIFEQLLELWLGLLTCQAMLDLLLG